MYVSGWLASGPVGVLQTTMSSAFSTGKTLINDINSEKLDISVEKSGKGPIIEILNEKGIVMTIFI